MRRPLLSTVTISFTAAFGAATCVAALTAPDVELVRPVPGEALVGGSEMIVEWKPTGPRFDAGIEEWEAFLSLNGGDYYAVRITPHLDISRRRFAFEVPDLATDDARIMLRFGDEEHEVGVETDHVFSIRPGFVPTASWSQRAPSRGEAARPGDPGVVAWVGGSRQGNNLARFEVAPEHGVEATVSPGLAEPVSAVIRRGDPPLLTPADERSEEHTAVLLLEATDRPTPPIPILLLGCRQNE